MSSRTAKPKPSLRLMFILLNKRRCLPQDRTRISRSVRPPPTQQRMLAQPQTQRNMRLRKHAPRAFLTRLPYGRAYASSPIFIGTCVVSLKRLLRFGACTRPNKTHHLLCNRPRRLPLVGRRRPARGPTGSSADSGGVAGAGRLRRVPDEFSTSGHPGSDVCAQRAVRWGVVTPLKLSYASSTPKRCTSLTTVRPSTAPVALTNSTLSDRLSSM